MDWDWSLTCFVMLASSLSCPDLCSALSVSFFLFPSSTVLVVSLVLKDTDFFLSAKTGILINFYFTQAAHNSDILPVLASWRDEWTLLRSRMFVTPPQLAEDLSLVPVLTVVSPTLLNCFVFLPRVSSHRLLCGQFITFSPPAPRLFAKFLPRTLSLLTCSDGLLFTVSSLFSLLSSVMIFEMSYVLSFNCRLLLLSEIFPDDADDDAGVSLMMESNFEARFATVWGLMATDILIPALLLLQQPFLSLYARTKLPGFGPRTSSSLVVSSSAKTYFL